MDLHWARKTNCHTDVYEQPGARTVNIALSRAGTKNLTQHREPPKGLMQFIKWANPLGFNWFCHNTFVYFRNFRGHFRCVFGNIEDKRSTVAKRPQYECLYRVRHLPGYLRSVGNCFRNLRAAENCTGLHSSCNISPTASGTCHKYLTKNRYPAVSSLVVHKRFWSSNYVS